MQLTQRILGFGHHLRDNEIPVDTQGLLSAQQIAELGYLVDKKLFKSGLRSCFCKSVDQWNRFDSLFDAYWKFQPINDDAIADPDLSTNISDNMSGIQSLVGFGGTSSEQISTDMMGGGDFKALSLADFRFVFDSQQMQMIEQMVDQLARRARRSYLRREKTANKGQRIDFSDSIRRSMRTSAHVIDFRYRQRQRRLPRFVLLIDVSQSMDIYSKLFMRYTRQLLSVFEQSSSYAFNIELIPLATGSKSLTERNIEDTLNSLAKGWVGGTKIAESLATFNSEYLRRNVNNKTTVLVFSDGFDTAPVEKLIPEVATLQRCCKKLIWVNPLLGRFEPDEEDPNMDQLQPYIDCYHSAHNLETLQLLENDLLS